MLYLTRESKPGTRATVIDAWTLFILMSSMIFVSGCSGFPIKPEPHVTVEEIVEMSEADLPEATIIDKIHRSGATYRLTASELADLRTQGVADAVINAMQETYLEAVRRDQQFNDRSYWRRYNNDCFYRRSPFAW